MDANHKTGKANDHRSPYGVQAWLTHVDEYLNAYARLQRLMLDRGEVLTLPTARQFIEITKLVVGLGDNYSQIRKWDDAGKLLLAKHLAFAMLVPGGKADRARQAVLDLEKAGFFRQRQGAAWKRWSAERVAKIVRPNVRFHNNKAKRLWWAILNIDHCREMFDSAEANTGTVVAAHTHLDNNIAGLGPKAKAHLMRNLGLFCDDMSYPIIDVHIHKILDALQFKHDTYAQAETSFYMLSELTGVPLLLLDAYIWCAYSGNWAPDRADFDNFGPNANGG